MSEPISIAGEKQLFIDDYCLEELCGTRRQFHQAKKRPEPVLSAQEAWEAAGVQAYGNVLYDADQKLFRIWYNAHYEPSPKKSLFTVCHAVSTDGINWERSKLDRLEHDGLKLSNAVLKGDYRGPTVLHTPDDPDPNRKYRMFVYTGRDIVDLAQGLKGFLGYGVMFSPDGLDWTPYEHNPIMQGGDIATCTYDPVTQEYIAFPKVCRTDEGFYRRCVGISVSEDFVSWSAPVQILTGDATDDARTPERLERFRDLLSFDDPSYYNGQMYGMTGFRYEGLRIGLVWFYDVSGLIPQEFGGNDDGVICTQLVYCRGRSIWHRPAERPDFITCGNEDDYDATIAYVSHGVVEFDDELWFYYNGRNRSHGSGLGIPGAPCPVTKTPARPGAIFLATLRRDGFASIGANYPPGRMVTKTMTFEGSQLEINADSEHGHIIVEILDCEGRPIPGFDKESCIPFREDAIRGRIKWKGKRSLAAIQDKPVRLVFHMQTARLYAFKFVE